MSSQSDSVSVMPVGVARDVPPPRAIAPPSPPIVDDRALRRPRSGCIATSPTLPGLRPDHPRFHLPTVVTVAPRLHSLRARPRTRSVHSHAARDRALAQAVGRAPEVVRPPAGGERGSKTLVIRVRAHVVTRTYVAADDRRDTATFGGAILAPCVQYFSSVWSRVATRPRLLQRYKTGRRVSRLPIVRSTPSSIR